MTLLNRSRRGIEEQLGLMMKARTEQESSFNRTITTG